MNLYIFVKNLTHIQNKVKDSSLTRIFKRKKQFFRYNLAQIENSYLGTKLLMCEQKHLRIGTHDSGSKYRFGETLTNLGVSL